MVPENVSKHLRIIRVKHPNEEFRYIISPDLAFHNTRTLMYNILMRYLGVNQFDLNFQENKIIEITHMEFDSRPVNNYKLSRQFRVISVLKSDFDISC